MKYEAPFWLPGGNLQTIWPALYSRRTSGLPARYRRERWTTPDGDFIDADWLLDDAAVFALATLSIGLAAHAAPPTPGPASAAASGAVLSFEVKADSPEKLWEDAPAWIEWCGKVKRDHDCIVMLAAMGLTTVQIGPGGVENDLRLRLMDGIDSPQVNPNMA